MLSAPVTYQISGSTENIIFMKKGHWIYNPTIICLHDIESHINYNSQIRSVFTLQIPEKFTKDSFIQDPKYKLIFKKKFDSSTISLQMPQPL